ncbi:peptidase S16 [Methanoculleus bourgensis]|uniref:Peptidase S16 n=2 Tax=Methanoculleus bourgensis TaxID=83986 RepID=A0A7K4C3W0_9EURY|nr:peptidase S16 [Methanoculleus bourgensis]MDD3372545.1 peptidase S16 [Methanoculleus bourgensis]NMA88848.1 peptidase S16 [Methanoculleus bourgensis]NQS77407.1 peptidase S16 [Methanoculleus bourgensis]
MVSGYHMRMREKTLATLLILSLVMNVFLLVVALVPGEDPARILSQSPTDDVCPVTTPAPLPTEKEAGAGGTASMQAPVILQKIEAGRGGPFSPDRVTEEGAMVDISAEVVPGRGRVLVQTTPLMGVVFQDAANQAVAVAQNHSHVNLSTSDIIFSIQGPEEVSEIDGPSAGALMTTLLLSVLEGFSLNENVTVTGTINENGEIGPVGGILVKAEAAAASGKTLLLLSEKNNQVFEYREETRTLGGLSIARQRPVAVDAKEYIEENYGIRVEYVDSIDGLLADVRLPAETPVTAVA